MGRRGLIVSWRHDDDDPATDTTEGASLAELLGDNVEALERGLALLRLVEEEADRTTLEKQGAPWPRYSERWNRVRWLAIRVGNEAALAHVDAFGPPPDDDAIFRALWRDLPARDLDRWRPTRCTLLDIRNHLVNERDREGLRLLEAHLPDAIDARAALDDPTRLMLASGAGDVEAVRFLLDAGANPASCDERGNTAHSYAWSLGCRCGARNDGGRSRCEACHASLGPRSAAHQAVLAMLLQAGAEPRAWYGPGARHPRTLREWLSDVLEALLLAGLLIALIAICALVFRAKGC
ncbi:MAG: ankyrin repeat domain-containing protein [Polyangiaceae bacterium]